MLNSENKPTGQFEAPPGDSNLTLTLEENEAKTEKRAYYLRMPQSTLVKFTLPSDSTTWVPTGQEGAAATDTATFTDQTVEQHNE